jgi:hypothetical protein
MERRCRTIDLAFEGIFCGGYASYHLRIRVDISAFVGAFCSYPQLNALPLKLLFALQFCDGEGSRHTKGNPWRCLERSDRERFGARLRGAAVGGHVGTWLERDSGAASGLLFGCGKKLKQRLRHFRSVLDKLLRRYPGAPPSISTGRGVGSSAQHAGTTTGRRIN